MCEPAPKRSRTAIVEGMALADSADMFDSQGEDNGQELDSNNAKNWSGVPLASLPRLQPHGSSPPPPPPVPGPSHTVAVKLPLQDSTSVPAPHPTSPRDVWDGDHVRFPWSKDNLYPQEQEGRKILASRWHLVISALTSNPIDSSRKLEQAILSYNTRYKDKYDWSFDGLHYLFEEVLEPEESEAFFGTTLPGMIELLRASPSILTAAIPLLKAGKTHSITLSQQQVAVILVNAFFCTFPRRNASKPNSEFSNYPMINFNALFMKNSRRMTACLEKLKCLLCYFSQIVASPRTGLITFSRLCLPPSHLPSWFTSPSTLSKLHISTEGKIETEGAGFLQADFANEFVGGGVLRSGLVQEEIRFTICPELIASMLFSECMQDTEAIFVVGVEQYSCYSGYGDSFRFEGRMKDPTERDTSGRRLTCLVAMDAIRFSGDKEVQFRSDKIEREIKKAFVAFDGQKNKAENLPAVATGNWGCGAFGGDPRLKLLLQLVAASEAGRDLIYFTFGDEELMLESGHVYRRLVDDGVTVGQLMTILASFYDSARTKEGKELFEFILQKLDSKLQTSEAVYDFDTDDELCEKSSTDFDIGIGKEDRGEESKSEILPKDDQKESSQSPQSFSQGTLIIDDEEGFQKGGPVPHAQGMLKILDSMEKGELLDKELATSQSLQPQNQGDKTENGFASNIQTTKQSKLTDYFKK